jgi:drug/metabolite transporter (DMT)-like permease
MISLAFGLIAALAWGAHDFGVRFVSRRSDAMVLFLATLIFGSLWLAPVTVVTGGWGALNARALTFAALSGFAYLLGGIGLYRAFAIGPVRLVAPIAGSYPVLSVGWAAIQGQAVTMGHWLAVLAVLCGIGIVASAGPGDHGGAHTGADAGTGDRRGAAIGWAIAGAVGFAMTFAAGHLAAEAAPGLPVILIARLITAAGVMAVIAATGRALRVHRKHLPILAGMGLLDVTALTFVIAAGGLPHPEYAAVASSIFGVVTILLAWQFLAERVTPAQWGGVTVVFAAIGYLAL